MANDTVTVFGVGDIGPMHEPVASYSTLIRSTLEKADIRFGQLERPYTIRGSAQLDTGVKKPAHPSMASVLTDCGFDVVSAASNHTMDWGSDGLMDTLHLIRKMGIQVTGAGEDLEEAVQPVYIDRNGVRVAFLGFTSVLREGCEAGPGRPGLAPMRAHSHYEAPNYQPGMPAKIITYPRAEDLALLTRTITTARGKSDAVVLSLHWGIPFIPRMIADYQPMVARAAIAAGADVIFGHHAHVPKAVGVYDGKVCFYSLSNFIMTSEYLGGDPKKQAEWERQYGTKLDPEYPRLPYGVDSKRSMIGKVVFSRQGLQRTSFLPLHIDKELRPEALGHTDPRFQDHLQFMEWVSEGYPHHFAVVGDEIVVMQQEESHS